MKRLLITALSLLLVFNGAGYQVINATEVDTQGEEISETSLPTEETDGSTDTSKEETNLEESNEENSDANVSSEETNSNDSDEENTDTNVSTEENDDAINDTTVDDTVQDSDSIDNSEAQIATVANEPIQELNKDNLKKYLRDSLPYKNTYLYFGTKDDYTVDLAKCTENADLGNGYKIYNYTDTNGVKVYVVCENGKQIIFPKDSSGMFSDFYMLKQITFKHIDTSNVTDMNSMFYNCGGLTSLDLSNFNTSNVKDMSSMFEKCDDLESLNVSQFNTENVTNMSSMFSRCEKLTSLNVSNFKTRNVTYMNGMFSSCKKLTSLNVSQFNTENVINMSSMFSGCDKLTSLDLLNFNTTTATNMHGMFSDCLSLKSLKISNFNNTNVADMGHMFSKCQSLTSLDLSHFNTDNVTNMEGMFWQCKNLKTLDLSNFNTSNVKTMYQMFYGCEWLETLNISSFNTSNVTDMRWMFDDCYNLTSLDLSNFNTSNVRYMNGMFSSCETLPLLDVSKFDTSKVINMNHMFSNCKKLTSLNVSNFDTTKVTDMNGMFYNCSSLPSLDVSKFNTLNVTDISWMFYGCNKLQSLDILSFNTAKVSKMNSMFSKCTALISLDISNFDTSNVTDMSSMFSQCSNITTIYANINFTAPNESDEMFFECRYLTGGNGTKLDSSHLDGEYARIDGRNSKRGYFTAVGPDKPTLSITETYKYNGNEQIASVTGFDSNTMEITGNEQTNAGTYTIKVTSKTGRWSDGTKDPVTIEWTIEKADPNPEKPTNLKAIQGDTLSEVKLPSGWSWNEPNTQITDSDSKTYKATFTPTDTENYKVLDNIELTVDVEAAPIKPTLSISGEYTYNGNEQTANVNGFDSNTMEITGNKKTNAGTYTVTVKPKTQWSDGTKDPVTVEWTIEKANPTYTVPTDLKANQGDKLSDIKLPEGWNWNEPDTKLDASGSKSYTASYTPKDTNNYNVLEKIELTVTVKAVSKPSDNSSTKQTNGWDDGGPFTTDKCGNVFDRWNNKIYEANGCNVGGYNLVRTSVID